MELIMWRDLVEPWPASPVEGGLLDLTSAPPSPSADQCNNDKSAGVGLPPFRIPIYTRMT
jgi:hypothetical protein